MWQTIYPYLQKTGRFLFKHITYIFWFCLYVLFSSLLLASFNFVSTGAAFAICIVLYLFSILIAAFLGEEILKLIHGVRPAETKTEKEYLFPIFEAVYADAKSMYPNLPKIKPFLVDRLTVNAFAIGSHTIAVTKGALNTFSQEELEGVIAHEIAHIHYGDTKVKMLNQIGNGFFSLYILVVNILFTVIDLFFHFDDPDMKHAGGLLRALVLLIRFSLTVTVYILLFVGNLLLAGNSRKNELRADKFAYEIGHGKGLTDALYILQDMSLGDKLRFVERMQESHPRVSMRIGLLEQLEGVQ